MPRGRIYDDYLAALSKQGKPTSDVKFAAGYNWLICSNDPDKTFNEAADHIIYQSNNYMEWGEKAGSSKPVYFRDRAHLRESGRFKVVEPDTCIKLIREYVEEGAADALLLVDAAAGTSPRWAQPHLELFASKVIPALRKE
jgi:hypothetical protein